MDENFLSQQDLKRRWRISTSTLKRLRRGNDLPCVDGEQHRPGRHSVRFALQTVLEWEQQHRAWLARMVLRKQNRDGHPCEEQPPETK